MGEFFENGETTMMEQYTGDFARLSDRSDIDTDDGSQIEVEYLYASSSYEKTTTIAGEILFFGKYVVCLHASDGDIIQIEAGEDPKDPAIVRRDGRKIGEIPYAPKYEFDPDTGITLSRTNYEWVSDGENNEVVTDGGQEMSLNIEIKCEVECYNVVDKNDDYVGEIFADVVSKNKKKAVEVRNVTLRESGPNPNLDFVTCYDTLHDFRSHDARQLIKSQMDTAQTENYVSFETTGMKVKISGSKEAWMEQVEACMAERPGSSAAEILAEYRSWDDYRWISVDIPSDLEMSSEKEIMTDGGEDMSIDEIIKNEIEDSHQKTERLEWLKRETDLYGSELERECESRGYNHECLGDAVECLEMVLFQQLNHRLTYKSEQGATRAYQMDSMLAGWPDYLAERALQSEIDRIEGVMGTGTDRYEQLIHLYQLLDEYQDTRQDRLELWDRLLSYSKYRVKYSVDGREMRPRTVVRKSSVKAQNETVRRIERQHGKDCDRDIETHVIGTYMPDVSPLSDTEDSLIQLW